MSISITDNTEAILEALNRQMEAGLEAVGQQAVSHAKQNITAAGRVDTGALRNSITSRVSMGEKAVYVGTNNDYAVYNELGTGIHAEGGRGRQTPWVYQDAKGEWHRTSGMKPIHFLKNAATEHSGEYRKIFEQHLKK